jgi:hypothetical protein
MYIIFHNSTRGGLYTIRLQMTGDSDPFPRSFSIVETKYGRETSYANLGQKSACDAVNEYNKRIDDYAKYDGIFFVKKLITNTL